MCIRDRGIPFPTEVGGAGGDHISYAITVQELSRVCASTGVIRSAHTSLCAWPIFNYGTDEQKAKYLPDLCSGRKLGAFGLTEPGAGTDAAGQQTKAVDAGDSWILNGSKCFITNGGYADVFIICLLYTSSCIRIFQRRRCACFAVLGSRKCTQSKKCTRT